MNHYLLSYWTESAFQDIIDVVHLDYQFAVGMLKSFNYLICYLK